MGCHSYMPRMLKLGGGRVTHIHGSFQRRDIPLLLTSCPQSLIDLNPADPSVEDNSDVVYLLHCPVSSKSHILHTLPHVASSHLMDIILQSTFISPSFSNPLPSPLPPIPQNRALLCICHYFILFEGSDSLGARRTTRAARCTVVCRSPLLFFSSIAGGAVWRGRRVVRTFSFLFLLPFGGRHGGGVWIELWFRDHHLFPRCSYGIGYFNFFVV